MVTTDIQKHPLSFYGSGQPTTCPKNKAYSPGLFSSTDLPVTIIPRLGTLGISLSCVDWKSETVHKGLQGAILSQEA